MAQLNRNILLYGDTGDGKTALLGEFAEHIYKTEGKKTRLASADRGGLATIEHLIDLGIIEVEQLGDHDPFIWLNKVCRGHIYDEATKKYRIDEARNANIGLWAFEGMVSSADAIMQALSDKAAAGINVGGTGNISLPIAAEGELLKVGGSNQTHYNVAQTRVMADVWASQNLPGWVLWTSSMRRDDNPLAAGKVLGPAIAGKALTPEIPRWFVYTFRVAAIPSDKGERHILYLGDHEDRQAGNAKGLGNTRVALGTKLPAATIEPASLVGAIKLIEAAKQEAALAAAKRLGMEIVK